MFLLTLRYVNITLFIPSVKNTPDRIWDYEAAYILINVSRNNYYGTLAHIRVCEV